MAEQCGQAQAYRSATARYLSGSLCLAAIVQHHPELPDEERDGARQQELLRCVPALVCQALGAERRYLMNGRRRESSTFEEEAKMEQC